MGLVGLTGVFWDKGNLWLDLAWFIEVGLHDRAIDVLDYSLFLL